MLLSLLAERLNCHKTMDFEEATGFAARQGLLVSFEHPIYSNGYFLGFEVSNVPFDCPPWEPKPYFLKLSF